MRLGSDERREEDADQLEIAARRPQDVLVVLVERIDRAGADREGLPGRHLDDLALAADAGIRLEMVLVVQVQLGAFRDDRVVYRAAHPVLAQDEAPALPAWPAEVALRAADIVETAYDHDGSLSPPAPAQFVMRARGDTIGF